MAQSITRPYVQSLYDFCKEHDCHTLAKTYLDDLLLLSTNDGIQHLIYQPGLSIHARTQALAGITKHINQHYAVFNAWQNILLKNNRFNLLQDIKLGYIDLLNQMNNQLPVTIESAFPLSEAELKMTTHYLSTIKPGWTFMFNHRINASLMSGIRLLFQDYVLDLSLANKWQQISTQLLNTGV